MRLICPNCGAQYEVDDGVVPDGGRDVQCSNCGHTWFQKAAQNDRGAAENAAAPAADEEPDQYQDVPEPFSPSTQADVDPGAAAQTSAEDEAPARRDLDPSVADILREEAEHETSQREAERSGLETQPDLGLPDGDDENAALKERMARLRGVAEDDVGAAAGAAAAGTRKDLLPDIEEINSTLTASSDRDGEETAEEYQGKRKSSGFRRGFSVTLLLFALLALIYMFAPQIAEWLPQTEPALTVYVDFVNVLRVRVDGLMQSAVGWLTDLLAQLGGGAGDEA